MPLNPLTLRQQVEATLLKVNMQIDVVENHAARRQEQANEMTYRDGKYVMIPLLVAKADLLNALLTLEVLSRVETPVLSPEERARTRPYDSQHR